MNARRIGLYFCSTFLAVVGLLAIEFHVGAQEGIINGVCTQSTNSCSHCQVYANGATGTCTAQACLPTVETFIFCDVTTGGAGCRVIGNTVVIAECSSSCQSWTCASAVVNGAFTCLSTNIGGGNCYCPTGGGQGITNPQGRQVCF